MIGGRGFAKTLVPTGNATEVHARSSWINRSGLLARCFKCDGDDVPGLHGHRAFTIIHHLRIALLYRQSHSDVVEGSIAVWQAHICLHAALARTQVAGIMQCEPLNHS